MVAFTPKLNPEKVKTIQYNGQKLSLLIPNNLNFFGEFKGKKSGFLVLNSDGSGEYKSDYSLNSCDNTSFRIDWGFLMDENGEIVKIKRSYGFSYPVVYKSLDGKRFKGCKETLFFDYLLEKNGRIEVSSSDDWKKNIN